MRTSALLVWFSVHRQGKAGKCLQCSSGRSTALRGSGHQALQHPSRSAAFPERVLATYVSGINGSIHYIKTWRRGFLFFVACSLLLPVQPFAYLVFLSQDNIDLHYISGFAVAQCANVITGSTVGECSKEEGIRNIAVSTWAVLFSKIAFYS